MHLMEGHEGARRLKIGTGLGHGEVAFQLPVLDVVLLPGGDPAPARARFPMTGSAFLIWIEPGGRRARQEPAPSDLAKTVW